MLHSPTHDEKCTATQLIADLHAITRWILAHDTPTCQNCHTELPAGTRITVRLSRHCTAVWRLSTAVCAACSLPPMSSPQRREMTVVGRVGTLSDPTTQTHWSVLLAPQLRAVSRIGTVNERPIDSDPPAYVPARIAEGRDPLTLTDALPGWLFRRGHQGGWLS